MGKWEKIFNKNDKLKSRKGEELFALQDDGQF